MPKAVFWRSPGASSAIFWARLTSWGVVKGMPVCMICADCLATASTRVGWLCPTDTQSWPDMRSRYSLPSTSHTRHPSPRCKTMSWTCRDWSRNCLSNSRHCQFVWGCLPEGCCMNVPSYRFARTGAHYALRYYRLVYRAVWRPVSPYRCIISLSGRGLSGRRWSPAWLGPQYTLGAFADFGTGMHHRPSLDGQASNKHNCYDPSISRTGTADP